MTALRLVRDLPTGQHQRDLIETLAEDNVAGRVPDIDVPGLLAELSPLEEADALEWFVELVKALFLRGSDWWEVIPDAVGINRDEQADDAVRDLIEAALNALTGVAR